METRDEIHENLKSILLSLAKMGILFIPAASVFSIPFILLWQVISSPLDRIWGGGLIAFGFILLIFFQQPLNSGLRLIELVWETTISRITKSKTVRMSLDDALFVRRLSEGLQTNVDNLKFWVFNLLWLLKEAALHLLDLVLAVSRLMLVLVVLLLIGFVTYLVATIAIRTSPFLGGGNILPIDYATLALIVGGAATGLCAYLGQDVFTKFLYDSWRHAANDFVNKRYPSMIEAELQLEFPLNQVGTETYRLIGVIDSYMNRLSMFEANRTMVQQTPRFPPSEKKPDLKDYLNLRYRGFTNFQLFQLSLNNLRTTLSGIDTITLELLIERWKWPDRWSWNYDIEAKLDMNYWILQIERSESESFPELYSCLLHFYSDLTKWHTAIRRDLRHRSSIEILAPKSKGR